MMELLTDLPVPARKCDGDETDTPPTVRVCLSHSDLDTLSHSQKSGMFDDALDSPLFRDRVSSVIEDFLDFRQGDHLWVVGHMNAPHPGEVTNCTFDGALTILARNVGNDKSC